MIGFRDYLVEIRAPEVNMSQRLLSGLSPEARSAIVSWEFSNWVTGDLEKAYKSKNSIYKEIEEKASELRDTIRSIHGNTITLYRGITKGGDEKIHTSRNLYSWTARKEVAALFAGMATGVGARDIKLHKDRKTANDFLLDLTDQEAEKIQSKVLKDGRAIYKSFLFKTSPYNDDYFEVYKKVPSGYSFFADDEKRKLASWLIRTRDEEKAFRLQVSATGTEKGYIVVDQIPVDDIVWVLNNGKFSGTLEYIVKGNSGMKSRKVEV